MSSKHKADPGQVTSSMYKEFLVAMLFLTALVSIMLLLRFSITGSVRYAFLIWNLMLAWASSVATLWLSKRFGSPTTWLTVSVLLLWVLFLPNAFYIVSDLIHLGSTGEVSILYDAVMLFSFAAVGFCLGLASLGVFHIWLYRCLGNKSGLVIGLIIMLCSFAIYLGRYLRWNSWDIFTNPLGLLVDVSNRVVYPLDNPRTLSTTLLFFSLISSAYLVCAWMARFTVRHLRP